MLLHNKMDTDILTGLCLSMKAWCVSASEQRANCARINVDVLYIYMYNAVRATGVVVLERM